MAVVTRTLTPLNFIILAKLLTPNDFGLLAIAQISISFSTLLWDAGLQKALIQTREPLEKAANIVFWINLALASIMYIIIFLTAPYLAVFLGSPESCIVLKVLSIQIIIGAFSAGQQSIFIRSFRFKLLFWTKLVKALIPIIVAVPLAYYGYGVWALVASSLSGSMINMIILWTMSSWRPKFYFDFNIAKKLTNFGSWIILDSLIGWLISQGDAVLVGRFLGTRDLGLYRTGRNIINVLFGLTLNPILPILYPTFSALQSDKDSLQRSLQKINKTIMALSLPIGTGMMCIASPFTSIVLGEQWKGIEIVLTILGLQTAFGWLTGANPEIYRALGKPDVQTKIALFSAPLYLGIYFFTVPFGLTPFLFARLGLSIITLPVHIFMLVKVLNVNYMYLWHSGKPIFISTIFMLISIYSMKWAFIGNLSGSPAIDFSATVFIGIVTYSASLWILDKPFILHLSRLTRKIIVT